MLQTWHNIQILIAALGGLIGGFLGGMDGFLYTLVAFIVIDYVTGFLAAIAEKNLSSEVGFRGIFRKIVILMLVGVANLLDVNIVKQGAIFRTAVIFFYLSNEGVSILENAGRLGLPIPAKLKAILIQLREESEEEPEEDHPYTDMMMDDEEDDDA